MTDEQETTPNKEDEVTMQQLVMELINAQSSALGILAAALGRHLPADQLKTDIEAIHSDVTQNEAPNPVLDALVRGMKSALTLPPPGKH